MLMDLAIFEPNHMGRRVYDRFLKSAERKLTTAEIEVARALARAFFSVFRLHARHEAAGVWLEDLLNGGPLIWVVDEGMEKSARDGLCFAARIFNVGDFHAGLGIIIPLDEDEVADYQALSEDFKAGKRLRPFAPLVYREAILSNVLKILNRAMAEMNPEELDQLGEMIQELDADLSEAMELGATQPRLQGLPAPKQRKRA